MFFLVGVSLSKRIPDNRSLFKFCSNYADVKQQKKLSNVEKEKVIASIC
jgi:hypothetical protein